jgi:septal ring factor EnvC (AmiA/AmiB activator)
MVLAAPAQAADPLGSAQTRVANALKAANDATGAYQDAQARYYELQNNIIDAQKKILTEKAEQERLAKLAQLRALVAYKSGPMLLDDLVGTQNDVMEAARRATLLDRINQQGIAIMNELTRVTDDLHAREKELRDELDRQTATLADMKKRSEQASAALTSAKQAESQLRAKLAEEKREAEYARFLAQAQTAARAREAAAAARAAANTASQHTGASNPGGGGTSNGGGGGGSGGGGGGTGETVPGAWVCPVQGAVSFHDDFGDPRGGGSRRHGGNDMFAATGTPAVAPTSGSMFFQSDPLGGLSFYVTDSRNNTYYGAHLNDYVGGSRSVHAGELIGHVGNTGDAAGGPSHLHFEIRVGGPNGRKIDPYPTLIQHC